MKSDTNEALTSYLNQAGEQLKLTPAQEKTATPDQLVSANLLLVVHISKRYSRDAEELMDTIQDGNEGLIIAANRFDPSRGKFSVCAAFHIKNKILEARMKMSRVVRLPKRTFNAFGEIKALFDKGLPVKQIAINLGLPIEAVSAAVDYKEEPIPEHNSNDDQPVRELSDRQSKNPSHEADKYLAMRLAKKLMTPKQYSIIMRRLDGYSAKEISIVNGVTNQAISFQESLGMKKLRGA